MHVWPQRSWHGCNAERQQHIAEHQLGCRPSGMLGLTPWAGCWLRCCSNMCSRCHTPTMVITRPATAFKTAHPITPPQGGKVGANSCPAPALAPLDPHLQGALNSSLLFLPAMPPSTVKGKRDQRPDDDDDADGAEGQCLRAALHPGDGVQHAEHAQQRPAEQHRHQQHVGHPLPPAHHLVPNPRHVACMRGSSRGSSSDLCMRNGRGSST